MEAQSFILLCGNRMAIPVMRNLLFAKKLTVIVIPEKCAAFAAQVQELIKETGIPVLLVNKSNCNDVLTKTIKKHKITIGLIVTFSYKLPSSVYKLPAMGFYNVHPGPLPAYRGPDPVFQQIKKREKKAGATIHKLDDGFDTGEIVLLDSVPLLVDDTYGIVVAKLAELAARMVDVLMKIGEFSSTIPSKKQDEEKSVYYKKQGYEEVRIDWQKMNADDIIALVNACNPWNKGAATSINNIPLKILVAEKTTEQANKQEVPGTVISFSEKRLLVAVMHNDVIAIHTVYMEEGFMAAEKLKQIGVIAGSFFK